METHVKQLKTKKFITELLPSWSLEENYYFSDLGKIWILWHPSVKVVVIAKSLQMITCEVLLPDSKQWIVVSIVYALNDVPIRKKLWEELKEISYSLINGRAWMALGDFNQVLHPQEHSSTTTLNVDRRIRLFRDCLRFTEVEDLIRGCTYTWWNKCPTRPVAKKLDRVLVNDA